MTRPFLPIRSIRNIAREGAYETYETYKTGFCRFRRVLGVGIPLNSRRARAGIADMASSGRVVRFAGWTPGRGGQPVGAGST
jgi:hypothetical protein